tara:strand:- start:146 stop:1108 length:963 start_codon:yes stop_codon:yes gene_type:complete
MNKNIIDLAKQVIDDEIDSLLKLKDNLGESIEAIADAIYLSNGKVILTGIGKSGHIARKISATLSSTGTSSYFMHSTEAFHGDLGLVDREDIVIAISNSGETDEVLKTAAVLKKIGCKIVGVSGNDNSSLQKISDYHQLIQVDKEACPLNLAPTSSTTSTLVWGDVLAIVLMEKSDFKKEDFALSHPGGSLGKRLLLLVEDLMLKDDEVPTNSEYDSSKDVLKEISEKGIGATFILSEEKKMIGLITDGDVRRAIDETDKFFSLKAGDFMTKTYITVQKDIRASECLEIMASNKIGCLPVMESGELIGAVNQKDLLKIGI